MREFLNFSGRQKNKHYFSVLGLNKTYIYYIKLKKKTYKPYCTAFISFMADNEWNHYGGRNDSEERRRQFAIESLQHCSNDAQFGELFPEVKQEIDEKIKLNEELQRKNSD